MRSKLKAMRAAYRVVFLFALPVVVAFVIHGPAGSWEDRATDWPIFMQLLCLLLVLVPAPREPMAAFPIGCWSAQWGSINQQMIFYPDGSYDSAEFGSGKWSTNADGWIWFSERNDQSHYVMWLDEKTGTGTGFSHCLNDGTYGSEVNVRLMLREVLPMPREAHE